MNPATFAVASVIAIVFVAIIVREVKKRKSGKGGCSCSDSCAGCAMKNSCHPEE